MNEAETRAEHIDPPLKAAGALSISRVRRDYMISPGRIEGHGRYGNPLRADYVLEYRNTKLAVIEAKAWDKALTEGLARVPHPYVAFFCDVRVGTLNRSVARKILGRQV